MRMQIRKTGQCITIREGFKMCEMKAIRGIYKDNIRMKNAIESLDLSCMFED